MKKIISGLVVLALCFSLTACGQKTGAFGLPLNPRQEFNVKISTNEGTETLTAKELMDIANNDQLSFNDYIGDTVTFTAEVKETEGNTHITNVDLTYSSALVFKPYGGDFVVYFDYLVDYGIGDKVTVTGKIDTHNSLSLYIEGISVN